MPYFKGQEVTWWSDPGGSKEKYGRLATVIATTNKSVCIQLDDRPEGYNRTWVRQKNVEPIGPLVPILF